MPAKFKIYPERKLLVDVIIGDVPYKHLKLMVLEEFKHPLFPLVNRIISDTRQATMSYTLEEIQDFIDFMGSNPAKHDFRWAMLASTPNQTALTILVTFDPLFKNVARVFSTLEACNQFLSLPYAEDEFQDADFIKFTETIVN
jgi:hypothetical protein